ncbi:threonine--tRNA ligase [Candidatus Falkowbacteria bacterium CG_4_10_14_0_2_um_filter_48_10]|uniref:Threonine--tRNA ligase n=1 Tax=Candidatus Falkowbacteria bacterium CG23_combo_of_CG06-09_8_20_14_all_49_15 TaxID=1974572 RepID=A0A2G9ZJV2_9BACT|nr:MAG: threonine--tRNA ligase [Candidatus Falkowbacteria bacterium CG23_combo_of_CG06-09_8_20_14_all_49_15]PJA08572.1 MAG: threonine--tRNA ligase [Candidatus Falkowbacteria bacterium CG_4_10_14_0_2_um_filter_48_10]
MPQAENHQWPVEIIRHSLSHVLAAAIKRLWPEAKFAIGPAIDSGFYYDIDFGADKISEGDLAKLEKIMREIIAADLPFLRTETGVAEALERAEKDGQIYKAEMIRDLHAQGEKTVSFYQLGDFLDLCRGPHLATSGALAGAGWRLKNLAGAYWRGSEKNRMLTRIYGLAFPTREGLDAYEARIAEAEKRNHVKLGRELDLFTLHEEGPGFPFFHPRGLIVWQELLRYWKEEHDREGYQEIKTPIILKKALWEQSGHWDHYRENMYFTKIDEVDYAVKPMNCPGGIIYYQTSGHSYRELPLKIAEIGLVHRHELSGVLNGLLRVRSFHQDDAHIYCTPEQIKDEVAGIVRLIDRIYGTFGLSYRMELSTRPLNSTGSDAIWTASEQALKDALANLGRDYQLNPGDGAFYGPKIDFHVTDALGRTWQCGTIQLDFVMPQRFKLSYTGADGQEHEPVMLHRVIYGAIERFIGILIEHFGGAFPLWLAPVQIAVIPVGAAHIQAALDLKNEMRATGLRAETDSANETVGNKIRRAIGQKIPYLVVLGDKEIASNELAVRRRGAEKSENINKKDFIARLQEASERRELSLV